MSLFPPCCTSSGFLGPVQAFCRDTRASVVTIFALGLPILCLGVAGAVEIAEVVQAKVELQSIVDSAAISGAKQLAVDRSSSTIERARLLADAGAEPKRARWSINTAAQADMNSGSMTISQDALRPSFFGSLLPPGGFHLSVSATATISSTRSPLCVLGLQKSGTKVVSLQSSAVLTAGSCLIQSDSDLVVGAGARVSAGAVQTAGAASGNIAPAPVTDTPPIPDPFASLNINVPGTCNDTDFQASGTSTLNPGVHCGSIKVHGSGRLILNPGEHYFVDAQLTFVGNAQLTGTDVVLIFKGSAAAEFKGNAYLSLEGRQSGPFSGFVLVTDRSFTNVLSISTDSARKLLGTIYLPNATLAVSGSSNKVADQSPWTVVVAKQLAVDGSAELVINSNYAASAVPVPSGVGPAGGVRLVN